MLKSVKALVDAGFAVHLLRRRSKIPLNDGWSTAPVLTYSELKREYEGGLNVGVRLGKPSRVDGLHLHIVDFDIRDEGLADEAREALAKLFPGVKLHRFPTVKSGSGGSSRHYYFLTEDPFRSKKLAHSDEFVWVWDESKGREVKRWKWEIELLGTGKQAVLPPSIHPDTGKPYEWLVEPDLEIGIPTIDAELLLDLTAEDEDFEHDNADPLGITIKDAEDALAEIEDWADDRETWVRVGMALKHEFGDDGWDLFDRWSKRGHGYDRRENWQQWRTFGKRKRDRIFTMRSIMAEANERVEEQAVIDAIGEMDDLDEIEATGGGKDEKVAKARKPRSNDPEMSILQQARFPAPALPLNILSRPWQREIELIAENAAAPVDFVFAALLAFSGAIVGNARWVKVRNGWEEPLIVWCQIIGSPSSNKSPAMSPFISIVNRLESDWEPEFRNRHRKWLAEKKIADSKRKQWEAQVTEKIQKGEEPDDMPAGCIAPPEPTKRRAYMTDTTLEALIRQHAGNERGFLNFRDELAGWFHNLTRYSNGTDRPAWLEAYGGRPYVVDRVKDEGKPIRVPRFTVGILGGIQPDRLLSILTDEDDGLQSRFLPFWPENDTKQFSFGTNKTSYMQSAFERLSQLRMRLKEDGSFEPYYMPLTKAALRVFGEWVDTHNAEEQYAPTRLKDVYGKANGQVVRIAINLELLDWAIDDFEDEEPREVGVDAIRRAIRFREEYLKPMQKRVFGHGAETDEARMAKNIAEWIVSTGAEEINARTIRRAGGIPNIPTRTEGDRVDTALLYLVSIRWLLPAEPTGGKGRPAKNYVVNERVWDLLSKKENRDGDDSH